MENQENNNLSKLDQLKAQYETLKQKFDEQEIVNERMMKSVVQNSTEYFTKYRKSLLIIYPILAVLGFVFLAHYVGVWALGFYFFLFMAIATVVELWLTRNVRKQVVENSDLLTLSKNMKKLKNSYAIYVVLFLVVFAVFILFATIMRQFSIYQSVTNEMIISTMFIMCVAGMGLLIAAVLIYYYFVSHCNNVLRQIDALTENHIVRNNRSFWLILGAVSLLCVIGAFGLYKAYDRVEYVRSDTDLSSEGKLAIWEIYADTTVFEKDVPAFMEQWQQNDSLVLMTGKQGQVFMEMEGLKVISRKEEEKQQVKLYTLRKTTPEGPVISSAVLGGKPMVEEVSHGHFRNRASENLGVFVYLTPDAAQLWSDFTRKGATEKTKCRAALCLDGVVYQEWMITGEISLGMFFVMNNWTKDEVKAFCERIIRQ